MTPNSDLQFHVYGWAAGLPARRDGERLVLVYTAQNRAAAKLWALEHGALFIIDTELGQRTWLHPDLQGELKIALAELDTKRRRAHNLARKYRAQLQRRTTEMTP